MTKAQKTKTELAAEYRAKFPETSTLTLAKLIYKEHGLLFPNLESARSALRYIEGKQGKKNRERTKNTFPDFQRKEDRPRNPFSDLPTSDAIERHPASVEGSRILFLSDIHFPYHNREALTLSLQYGHDKKPDCIYLNGDIIDAHQLSDYEKSPYKRRFVDELEMVKEFFAILRREFPRANIYYKEGNHEERYTRFMKVKAPELLGIQAFALPELLGLSQYNIQFVPGRTKANIGALSAFHGHEFGKTTFSPVNVARGLYMRAKANAICGHSHQTSEHSERDVNDRLVTTWSVGCLCEISPDYSPYNRWNHGFAFIHSDGHEFEVENRRIYRGRVV